MRNLKFWAGLIDLFSVYQNDTDNESWATEEKIIEAINRVGTTNPAMKRGKLFGEMLYDKKEYSGLLLIN